MPIVTIAHRCENSETNRLNPAAGKITAMQSGSSVCLKKVMFGSSHSKVSSPTPPLEPAANLARLISTFTDSTAVNHSGQPDLYVLAKLRPNPSTRTSQRVNRFLAFGCFPFISGCLVFRSSCS